MFKTHKYQNIYHFVGFRENFTISTSCVHTYIFYPNRDYTHTLTHRRCGDILILCFVSFYYSSTLILLL